MTKEQLISSWKKGQADPVYLLYGEEEFTRSELLDTAIDMFLPDPGMRAFNLDKFYGQESHISDVLTCSRGFPVMTEKRIVIVRDADKLWRFREKEDEDRKDHPDVVAILNYLEKPNFDCILIFDSDKPGAKNQYPWKTIFAKSTTLEFKLLREDAVADWIYARAKRSGRDISEGAARLLVEYIGSDLRAQSTELEKIITYIGDSNTITEDDVKRVVGNASSYESFELTKAIGAGNEPLAMEMAIKMLTEDKSARFPMFAVLIRYFEQLIVAKEMQGSSEKDVAAAIGLFGPGAYYAKEYIAAARKFPREKLDRAIKTLVGTELQTRRVSGLDEKLLVQKMLGEILQ